MYVFLVRFLHDKHEKTLENWPQKSINCTYIDVNLALGMCLLADAADHLSLT